MQLDLQRLRKLVRLDVAAPALPAHVVDHSHGRDGRGDRGRRLHALGGVILTRHRHPVGERVELVLQRGQLAPARRRPRSAAGRARSRARAGSAPSRRRRPPARTASGAAPPDAGRARRRACALPGSWPARTSASRRSICSGGVSASASRSSRARSAACSSLASSAAACAAISGLAAARIPRSERRAFSSSSLGRGPPAAARAAAPERRAVLEALRRLLRQRAGDHGVEAPGAREPAAAARRGAPRACARRCRAGTAPGR